MTGAPSVSYSEFVEAARKLVSAAMKVPVVHRPNPDNGPPFSVCLGCGAHDADDCKPGCWASTLEFAADDLNDYVTAEEARLQEAQAELRQADEAIARAREALGI